MASRRSRALAAIALALVVTTASVACSKDGSPTSSPTAAPAATVTETVTATATAEATSGASPAVTATTATTASTSPTATASGSGSAAPTATAATTGGKLNVGYVRGIVVKEGGTWLVWDRAAVVDGKVANPDTSRRLVPLAPDYKVIAGPFFGSSPDGFVSQESFEAAFPAKQPPLMRLRFDDAGQVRLVQQYSPS